MSFASFNLASGTPARLHDFLQRHPHLAQPARTTITWKEGLYPRPPMDFPLQGTFTGMHPEDVYDLHTMFHQGNEPSRVTPYQMVWQRDEHDRFLCTIYMIPVRAPREKTVQILQPHI